MKKYICKAECSFGPCELTMKEGEATLDLCVYDGDDDADWQKAPFCKKCNQHVCEECANKAMGGGR